MASNIQLRVQMRERRPQQHTPHFDDWRHRHIALHAKRTKTEESCSINGTPSTVACSKDLSAFSFDFNSSQCVEGRHLRCAPDCPWRRAALFVRACDLADDGARGMRRSILSSAGDRGRAHVSTLAPPCVSSRMRTLYSPYRVAIGTTDTFLFFACLCVPVHRSKTGHTHIT